MAMDLTDSTSVQTYLGASYNASMNTLITQLITAVSTEVAEYCGRVFESASYSTWQAVGGCDRVYTLHYPVTAVKRIATCAESVAYITYAPSSAVAYATVSIVGTTMTLAVPTLASTIDLSTASTVTLVDAAIAALASDWSMDVVSGYESWPMKGMIESAGQNAQSPVKYVLQLPGEPTGNAVLEDAAIGLIVLSDPNEAYWGTMTTSHYALPYKTGRIYIEYTAGYANLAAVPEDLQEIVTEMVCETLRSSRRDPGLTGETLDNYSWQAQIGSTTVKSVIERHAARLAPHVNRTFP